MGQVRIHWVMKWGLETTTGTRGIGESRTIVDINDFKRVDEELVDN